MFLIPSHQTDGFIFWVLNSTKRRRHCYSQLNKHRHWHAGGDEHTFVSLIGQAVQFVLLEAPGPVRGGQAGGILSPLAWVGSSSSQGGRREEEIKPLAFVARLGIKDGGGIKGG